MLWRAALVAFVLVACGGSVTADKPEAGPCDPIVCSLDCAPKCSGSVGAVGTCSDAGCQCDCIK